MLDKIAHEQLIGFLGSNKDPDEVSAEALGRIRNLAIEKARASLKSLKDGHAPTWAEFLVEQMLADERHRTTFAQLYKDFSPFKGGALVRFRSKSAIYASAAMEGEVAAYCDLVTAGKEIDFIFDHKRAGEHHTYFLTRP